MFLSALEPDPKFVSSQVAIKLFFVNLFQLLTLEGGDFL